MAEVWYFDKKSNQYMWKTWMWSTLTDSKRPEDNSIHVPNEIQQTLLMRRIVDLLERMEKNSQKRSRTA